MGLVRIPCNGLPF